MLRTEIPTAFFIGRQKIFGLEGLALYAYAWSGCPRLAYNQYIPGGFCRQLFRPQKMINLRIGPPCPLFCLRRPPFTQFSPLILLSSWTADRVGVDQRSNFISHGRRDSRGSNVGKYTGYYYTFSMAAQIATPILSGAVLEFMGYQYLFPYGSLFVALSFVTMIFVRHGDSRPVPPKTKLEAFDVDD